MLLAASAVLAGGACRRGGGDGVERAVREKYEPLLDQPLASVRCPEAADSLGEPFDCQVSAPGLPFTVQVSPGEDGWWLTPRGIVFVGRVADDLRARSRSPDDWMARLDCQEAARFVPARRGESFTCRSQSDGAPVAVEVRVLGEDGNYVWDVYDPSPPARARGAGFSVPVPQGWQLAEGSGEQGSVHLRAQRRASDEHATVARIVVVPGKLPEPVAALSPELCAAFAEQSARGLEPPGRVERSGLLGGPRGAACEMDIRSAAGSLSRSVGIFEGTSSWLLTCAPPAGTQAALPAEACRHVAGGLAPE